jgi:rfaE bifunctional protein kinase chain/domain
MLIDKLIQLKNTTKKPSVLVIGDLMVDHYINGNASRLSPEAPVPIVNLKNETVTLGGAGNVVKNLVALGAEVSVAGIAGDDLYGKQLLEILNNEHVSTDGIVTDSSRPTTVKTRVLVGSHQMIRIDREITDPVSNVLEDQLLAKITSFMQEADMVVFSDYNKGLFSPSLTQRIIAVANDLGKKIIVDPKGLNYAKYKGVYMIKPNRKELAEAANVERVSSIEDLQEASKTIFAQTNTQYLVVTLSEEGMAILSELTYKLLPVKATEVFDVTGAGDTVLATMAYFMALGFNVEEACEVANNAAAIVIKRIGSATTNIGEIIEYIDKCN